MEAARAGAAIWATAVEEQAGVAEAGNHRTGNSSSQAGHDSSSSSSSRRGSNGSLPSSATRSTQMRKSNGKVTRMTAGFCEYGAMVAQHNTQ